MLPWCSISGPYYRAGDSKGKPKREALVSYFEMLDAFTLTTTRCFQTDPAQRPKTRTEIIAVETNHSFVEYCGPYFRLFSLVSAYFSVGWFVCSSGRCISSRSQLLAHARGLTRNEQVNQLMAAGLTSWGVLNITVDRVIKRCTHVRNKRTEHSQCAPDNWNTLHALISKGILR